MVISTSLEGFERDSFREGETDPVDMPYHGEYRLPLRNRDMLLAVQYDGVLTQPGTAGPTYDFATPGTSYS